MMALNLDKLWMQKEDFVDFRDISANVKDSRLDVYIREAQFLEIRLFLGAELYDLMQEDYDEGSKSFTEPLYQSLWFGVDGFHGYMNAGIYFAYSRFLLQQQVNVSRFGVESVQNEISEDVSNAQIRSKTNDARKVAFKYQEETLSYLEENKTDYPEFIARDVQKNRTAFSFFKL